MSDSKSQNPSVIPKNVEVTSLTQYREIKRAKEGEELYKQKLANLSKLELLEEMVRFQEERRLDEKLSIAMMVRGHHLFTQLEERADTRELQILARAYRRHLEYELDHLKVAKPVS